MLIGSYCNFYSFFSQRNQYVLSEIKREVFVRHGTPDNQDDKQMLSDRIQGSYKAHTYKNPINALHHMCIYACMHVYTLSFYGHCILIAQRSCTCLTTFRLIVIARFVSFD